MTIPIYENYKDYEPPGYAYPTISKLLSNVPNHYLSGLQSVVLTNSAAIGDGKTRRVAGKKYFRRECLGFYHPKRKGEEPWIEIVVDNVMADFFRPDMPKILARISFLQKMAFSDTLYHEVGHHIDHTIGAPAPSGEAAAEAWKDRLVVSYFKKHYRCLMPILRLVIGLLRPILEKRLNGSPRAAVAAHMRR
jgi:hypothetical protein